MADERFEVIRRSIIDAPVIMKGEYPYFIHPLSDGVPSQSSELLAAARDLIYENVDWSKVDIILGIEAMGIPLAAALCLKSGNCSILRGGSEAIHSNKILANLL